MERTSVKYLKRKIKVLQNQMRAHRGLRNRTKVLRDDLFFYVVSACWDTYEDMVLLCRFSVQFNVHLDKVCHQSKVLKLCGDFIWAS